MPRSGVPYPERVLCSLKNTIAMIEQKLGLKIEKINGVGPDPSGSVTLASGDAALTIEEDAAQHLVTIGLDRAELPNAAVTSVNGETGAVVLDADDIAGRGAGNSVMDNIITLESGALILRSDLNDEITARGNVDAALQNNINALQASIPSIVEDAVTDSPLISQKVTGTGNIGTNTRPIKIVNGEAVAVGETLAIASQVVMTTGNKTIAGNITFTGILNISSTSRIDHYNRTDFITPSTAANGEYFIARDNLNVGGLSPVQIDALRLIVSDQGQQWIRTIGLFGNQYQNQCGIRFVHYTDTRKDRIELTVKNSDGTVKTVTIAEGD